MWLSHISSETLPLKIPQHHLFILWCICVVIFSMLYHMTESCIHIHSRVIASCQKFTSLANLILEMETSCREFYIMVIPKYRIAGKFGGSLIWWICKLLHSADFNLVKFQVNNVYLYGQTCFSAGHYHLQ